MNYLNKLLRVYTLFIRIFAMTLVGTTISHGNSKRVHGSRFLAVSFDTFSHTNGYALANYYLVS